MIQSCTRIRVETSVCHGIEQDFVCQDPQEILCRTVDVDICHRGEDPFEHILGVVIRQYRRHDGHIRVIVFS